MTEQKYVYDAENKFAYKIDNQGMIIGKYSDEESKKLKQRLGRGNLVNINGKKYWFFCDIDDQLWIMGDIIAPIKVTPQVTSKIEGEMWEQRRLTVYEENKIHFTVDYVPVRRDISYAVHFDEQDDHGLYIHNVLHDQERRGAWTDTWVNRYFPNE